MPNLKSAIKRVRQNKKRRAHNKSQHTAVMTGVKKVLAALQKKDKKAALEALNEAVPLLDKAALNHLIHRNNASRKISRLTQQVNRLS